MAGEFLAAIDDVLTRWSVITVRRLALDTVDTGSVVRVARDRVSEAEEPRCSWSATFDKDLAADPNTLARVLEDLRRPGAAVAHAEERPVYAATVREFGRAFDLAGGGRARRRAQRSLIGEYLSGGHDCRGATLGRVVAGYQRWRDQLGGASFDRGRFDPGPALAEACTDVILNGDNATEPAKTLCRLLIDTAAEQGSTSDNEVGS